jgi:hypothetical protein
MRITSTGSASAGMFAQPVHAQTSATAILELDIENIVNYVADASDVPKFATKLTSAMRAVSSANEELKGVFTVDWNQPAPDGSGKPLIPNEVVHALIQHFDAHDFSNHSVPPDILGRAYEYLIKQFADDAGAKASEFFTPPEVVDTLVRILEPTPDDTVYDPTGGSGGMLVHSADYLREQGHHATSAQYFAQEMNWGNAAIGKINSVLHGLEANIAAGVIRRFLLHVLPSGLFTSATSDSWPIAIGRQNWRCAGPYCPLPIWSLNLARILPAAVIQPLTSCCPGDALFARPAGWSSSNSSLLQPAISSDSLHQWMPIFHLHGRLLCFPSTG